MRCGLAAPTHMRAGEGVQPFSRCPRTAPRKPSRRANSQTHRKREFQISAVFMPVLPCDRAAAVFDVYEIGVNLATSQSRLFKCLFYIGLYVIVPECHLSQPNP